MTRGKNTNFTESHGFPGADDEVGQHHHPSGGEADPLRKDFGGVGDFGGRVGHAADQAPVHIANGEEQRAADGKSENRAENAAAQQPVVHHHQPADADHGAPSQGEVVDDAEFAG